MSARDTLAAFVAAGNLRDADPSPEMDPEKAKELRQRIEALRTHGGKPPDAGDAPGDFRADIEAREAKAAADLAAKRGLDVPRWKATNAVMKHIYAAHDRISSMPAPGGIAAILFIIFIFFLVLIPVTSNGTTRALLLWDVLLGQKELQNPAIDTAIQPTGSGIEKVAQAGQQATGAGSSTVVIPPLVSSIEVAAPLGGDLW